VPDDRRAWPPPLDEPSSVPTWVLTSGGVSVGDADYTKDLLASPGEVAFWKVAMRRGGRSPSGPLHGPKEKTAWLFALPGNPVAALVTYYVFARDALLALAGAQPGRCLP